MSGIHMVLMGAGGFSPFTNTYTSGTGATETVPTGAKQVVITADGGGGAGGFSNSSVGGGGGGGARSVKTLAVTGGNTFVYTVAAAAVGRTTQGSGTNGNDSQVTGSALGMIARGGLGGAATSGGSGGNASGGDTNTSGSAGSSGGNGGAGASGAAGGTAPGDGAAPGGGGGGSGPTFSNVISGSGARGQISFAYT